MNIVCSAIFFPSYLRLKRLGVAFRTIVLHSLLDIEMPRLDALLLCFLCFVQNCAFCQWKCIICPPFASFVVALKHFNFQI